MQTKTKLGFTLIEMIVVVGIIGLLSTLLLTSVSGIRKNSIDTRRKANLENVRGAINMYYSVKSSWPCDFAGSSCADCTTDDSNSIWCKMITKLSTSGFLSDNVKTDEDGDDVSDYTITTCSSPCLVKLCSACESKNGEECTNTSPVSGDTRNWYCLEVK